VTSIARSTDPELAGNLSRLSRALGRVGGIAASMRTVSIGSLFSRMQRLIEDLSRNSAKPIAVNVRGGELTLDRSMAEELAEPMVHLIRNAVDHGIESPAERREAGKPEQGRIRLEARREGGDLVIEVADDGRGLDRAKILAKARRLGLIPENEEPDMEATFQLIFKAGLTTADQVTHLSGRGVGMDIVNKRIQRLGGHVSIWSVPGQGCAFTLRLPAGRM
jgi:two-component system, chemotaxis family, sensor kinase CheA